MIPPHPRAWLSPMTISKSHHPLATARAVLCAAALLAAAGPVRADAIPNPVAVFSGLDKITANITTFEVAVNETRRFGQLEVTPRVCNSRPPTEEPKTTSFVEVDEIEEDGSKERVFSGWMFAESPGLHAVEHPVYDVWLVACRDPRREEATPQVEPEAPEIAPEDIPKDTD